MVILAILCPCRLRPKWGSQAVDQEEISKCEEGKWMTIVWFPLVKQCFICKTKQTQEYFGTAAWKARESKRRVCLQCQAKTRGSWTCTACQQRKPQQQFSMFISKRPSGEDGTQICNTCRTAIVQDAIRKRAATSATARLEPLRNKIPENLAAATVTPGKRLSRNRWQPKTGAVVQLMMLLLLPSRCPKRTPKNLKKHQIPHYELYVCPACGKATKSSNNYRRGENTRTLPDDAFVSRMVHSKQQNTHLIVRLATRKWHQQNGTHEYNRSTEMTLDDICKSYQWTSAGPK